MVNYTFLPKRWTEVKAYYSFKIFLRLWLAQIWQNQWDLLQIAMIPVRGGKV